jgi:hypothetical protein
MPDVPGKVKGDGLDAQVTLKGAKAGGEATIRFELTDAGSRSRTFNPTWERWVIWSF